jgi:phosphate uptake regulator
MELRKIQVTGGSTHVVSLPKKWIDRNRLGRSHTVAIHEEPDGSLLLIPHGEGKSEPRSLAVPIPEQARPEEVVRRIVGAYLAGPDEIHVRTQGRPDPRVREAVLAVARSLVGVEVVEEGLQGMVLQDLVGVADMDLRKTLNRMHRIARLMYDEACRALEQGDAQAAAEVQRRDDEVDRLLWLVSKQMHALLEQPRLAARLGIRPAEALNLFLAARSLERMADHAAKIGANVVLLQGRPVAAEVMAAILAQARRIAEVWDEAFSSLKRPDFALASRAADAGEAAGAWRASFADLARSLPSETLVPLTLVTDSIDRTRGYAVDLAETAMNQTFQQMAGAARPTPARPAPA